MTIGSHYSIERKQGLTRLEKQIDFSGGTDPLEHALGIMGFNIQEEYFPKSIEDDKKSINIYSLGSNLNKEQLAILEQANYNVVKYSSSKYNQLVTKNFGKDDNPEIIHI